VYVKPDPVGARAFRLLEAPLQILSSAPAFTVKLAVTVTVTAVIGPVHPAAVLCT
jgi:hypothetical protein